MLIVEDGLSAGLVSVLVEDGLSAGLVSVLVVEGLFTGLVSVEFLISLINLFFKSLFLSAVILFSLNNSSISFATLRVYLFASELFLIINLYKILVVVAGELSTKLISLILFSFKKF